MVLEPAGWGEARGERLPVLVVVVVNIARIANLPYGQSQLYLKSAFIKRKALIKKNEKKLKKS